MFIFENLLRNEYFPEELPPCFQSDSFADNHEQIRSLIKSINSSPADPLTFSGYKNTNSRRKFSIPNPLQYAKAADVIVSNSTEIFKTLKKANHSLTVPLAYAPAKNECYRKAVKKISESKAKIEKMYPNNLCEIRLDIQSFFDSVYTHSIAWAMHTKCTAKKHKKDKTLVGNLIDTCLQNLNSGQTNGIVIGNSISRIVSEIILSSVDLEISNQLPGIKYVRYVDDYYIFIKDASQINEVLSVFRQELAKYELRLNENKLQINSSPFIYGKAWVEQIRAYARLEPQLLLEKAIIEYHTYKDISILRYALNVIRGMCFNKGEWEKIEPLIFNIWISFPNLSNVITVIFKSNENYLKPLLLKNSIYTILDTHISLKNDEEVIWAIWAVKIFNIKISQNNIERIFDTDNWIAIIILLDILSTRKNEPKIKKEIDKFRNHIIDEYFSDSETNHAMYSNVWLLAYEADKNKWLNTSGTENFMFARKDDFFKELRKLKVDFYSSSYNYDIIGKSKSEYNIYVTRKELIELLKEYKLFFEEQQIRETPPPANVNLEEQIYVKIINALKDVEKY